LCFLDQVRECAAQLLALVLATLLRKALPAGRVVSLLGVLTREPAWEIRHGGFIGLKYLMALRTQVRDTGSKEESALHTRSRIERAHKTHTSNTPWRNKSSDDRLQVTVIWSPACQLVVDSFGPATELARRGLEDPLDDVRDAAANSLSSILVRGWWTKGRKGGGEALRLGGDEAGAPTGWDECGTYPRGLTAVMMAVGG
jgi:hypothetical protein